MSAVVSTGAMLSMAGCGRFGGNPSGGASAKEMDRQVKAIKGDFNITVNLEGTLDAFKRHVITCPEKARYGLEIIQIVADQTPLTNGSSIVRFAPQKYLDRERELTMALDDERKNLQLAEEDRRMQTANNIATLKDSADKVKQAQEAYDRYLEEDAPFNKKKTQSVITQGAKNLAKVRQQIEDSRVLLAKAQMQGADKIAALSKQLEDAQKDEATTLVDLAKGQYDFRMFKQYDYPEKLRTLGSGRTKANMDLKNNVVQAAGKLLQSQQKESAITRKMMGLQKEMDELHKMMAALELKAPVDGLFTVGDERRRRYGDSKEIIVGTQMSPNEVIGSIPELSKFLTRISIPELYRSKIRIDLPAALTVKALPGMVMTGTVSKIASMASQANPWDESSPKQYQAEISTGKTDSRLMPGMTMQVEIVVDTVRNALHLPVESLYSREGRVYCRIKNLASVQEREVKKGRSSDDLVEILSGITEGELVLVHRPGTGKEDNR